MVDSNMQLTAPGVVGELYIGGIGVASGYLKNDVITSTRFVSNIFDSSDEYKLYKTGDCVKYLANGDIEYVGRCVLVACV